MYQVGTVALHISGPMFCSASVHHRDLPTYSRLSINLQGEVEELRGSNSRFAEEKAVLDGSLSNLQGEVKELRGSNNSLIEEKAVLQGSLSSLQDQVGVLRQNVQDAQASCRLSILTCMSCIP